MGGKEGGEREESTESELGEGGEVKKRKQGPQKTFMWERRAKEQDSSWKGTWGQRRGGVYLEAGKCSSSFVCYWDRASRRGAP